MSLARSKMAQDGGDRWHRSDDLVAQCLAAGECTGKVGLHYAPLSLACCVPAAMCQGAH